MNKAAHVRALRLRPTLLPRVPQPCPLRIPTRHATTAANEAATNARSTATRTKNFVYGTLITLGLSFGYLYVTDTRASIHEWLVVPALRQIYPDGEDAHHAGTSILKALYAFGLHPRERGSPDAAGDLEIEIFGHKLSNPIGTSAGIDKGAEVPSALLELGPAIVEVGAVTALPQEGNPKPRVFRLPSQNALINRYGFNSEGAGMVAMRLRQRVREFAYHLGLGIDEEAERMVLDGEAGVPPGSLTPGKLMAVQVAKNKDTSENDIEAVVRDYTTGVSHLGKYADIIVVNVSSPNTPGLRTLQNVGPLTQILNSVVAAAKKLDRKTKPIVMVKVSPDEDTEEQVSGICEAIWDSDVDGVIVGNTTKKRPDPIPKGYLLPQSEASLLMEQGGYSGPQMFERTLSLVKKYRKTLDDGPKQLPATPSQSSSPREPPVGGHSTGDEPDSSIISKLESAKSSVGQSSPLLPSGAPAVTANVHSEPSPIPSNPDDLEQSAPTLSSLTPAPSSPPSPPSSSPAPLTPAPTNAAPAPSTPPSRKVIFATGGITNGRQAREILDAGASVAMVYTALIYGGVGTISRIKEEMRAEERK